MVKIIKNRMEEAISIQCPWCQSDLEYTFQDIQRDDSTGLYFSLFPKNPIRYIICPVCKKDINIEKTEVKIELQEK